ncbi:hypothetical protein GN244_ATG11029 [Phytophthora infestans]|uniref:Uncharacterized protein n=1 Tax=Phytophthora infestans TaxID=4787 RepID=A0A833WIS1_PHYIN|nr:hypothetical protein GN244_ATG11029 [Phytophthora infestans]
MDQTPRPCYGSVFRHAECLHSAFCGPLQLNDKLELGEQCDIKALPQSFAALIRSRQLVRDGRMLRLIDQMG